MRQLNHTIVNCDTDSISFCKSDYSPFPKDELDSLLKELNDNSPDFINWEDDGYYKTVIVLKSKNYILYDGEKIKKKGSGLKSATLEPIIKNMLDEIIWCIIKDEADSIVNIYHKYIKMASNIKDITPWAKKMTLSPTTFNSTRANETKVIDAIKGTEYKSGDRIYVYITDRETLKLAEQFDGQYSKSSYYKKLHSATKRFETILPVKEMFINYSLKKNINLAEGL